MSILVRYCRRKVWLFILLLCLLLVVDAMFSLSRLLDLAVSHQDYLLQPGTSVTRMLTDLQQRKIIKHPREAMYIKIYLLLSGQQHAIKAGEYRFVAAESVWQILHRMIQGDVLYHQVQLIEGWSYAQVQKALMRHSSLKRTAESKQTWPWLRWQVPYRDGLFFPDTYYFTYGTTDEALLERAHRALLKYLLEAWAKRDENLPYKTPYQALIAASLVEKETGLASERAMIAGVIRRRLQKGMRLQFDPTVIYALGAGFDGNLTKADLRIDNPFNTYRYKGLPPAPIALPSAAAIDAVLHPDHSDYLYFVARGDGSHAFSATINKHIHSVRQHQLSKTR